MKKAKQTLFQSKSWISFLGKSLLLSVFAWCCLGLQTVEAQVIQLARGGVAIMPVDATAPHDSLANCYKLDKCDSNGPSDAAAVNSPKFVDDGNNDGNYYDGHMRRDTTEICPDSQWDRVKIIFTKFDVEKSSNVNTDPTSDTLLVFDGSKDSVRVGAALGLGSGTGVGVPQAFGGWVNATCNPDLNPRGCLTFVFKTDGDNRKGAGWEAWVDCEKRVVDIDVSDIDDVQLKCDDKPFANIRIPAPVVKVCGDTLFGTSNQFLARVMNRKGEICIDVMLSFNASGAMTPPFVLRDFGIGQYTVEYKLKSDTTKTALKSFAVKAPALTCNDTVSTVFGAACMIAITPDMVLEDPCDTLANDTLTYRIVIKINGVEIVSGDAKNIPVLTKQAIKDKGFSICKGTATVEITRTYKALATTCNNGNQSLTCSTVLKYTDDTPPVFKARTARRDTIVACDEKGIAALIVKPEATDNCDSVKITSTFDDVDFTDVCVNSRTVIITHTAEDECGNKITTTDVVVVLRPTQFTFPATDTLECKATDPGYKASGAPRLKTGKIVNGVFTQTDSIELDTLDYVWGYILRFDDLTIDDNDCGKKVFRTWSYLDWCNAVNGPKPLGQQFIHYFDSKAPVFTDKDTYTTEAKAKLVDLDPNQCTKVLKPATPPSMDLCDVNPTEKMFKVEQKVNGTYTKIGNNLGEVNPLVCDTFKISWRVYDKCHTQLVEDTICRYFIIRDVEKPSAVCTDELIVSVPSDDGARIYAKDIDGGSFDACDIDTILIRRKDTNDPWTAHIDIKCTDVHEKVLIEMRVWDKKGLYNTCWMTVTAEDKIRPICKELGDHTLTCDEIHTGELGASTDTDGDGNMEDSEWQLLTGKDLETYNTRFGHPSTVCVDNLTCRLDLVKYEQEYQLVEDGCGALRAKRQYRMLDWKPNKSNWVEQKITVTYKPKWTLTFPKDIDLDCNNSGIPAPYTKEQIISNGSCDLWALEEPVAEKIFDVPGDICMKIERTYELINWCKFNAGDAATVIANNPLGTSISHEGNENVGRITYTQVIKLYVTEAPTVVINEVETCIVGVGDAQPFNEEDDSPNSAPYECDTLREFSATATNCMGVALADFTWKFYIDGAEVDAGSGASFTKVVTPKVKYKVEFWASDGCGNSAGESKDFEFWDCKNPTPYVLNGVAIELGQDGMVETWAKDLDRGSYDNCTDQKDLRLRINLGQPSTGPTDVAGVLALGEKVKLTCDNVGTQIVSIYVVDEEDRYDVVETYVLVQSNNYDCTKDEPNNGSQVAGKILNPNGENVEQVFVTVTGGAIQESMTTGADGKFEFDLQAGANITLTPVKDLNPLNGVSTFDLVLISKHILGITNFDSPYKYIAADVNKSGSITAFDLVQLRQLILNITTKFPQNDSWRFVDSKYNFTTSNPADENFGEFMNITNLTSDKVDLDFVGVKVGDVNGSSSANSLLGADVRSTNGTFNFNVADRFVEAGETVNVDFTSADIASTQGYQFTMNFAGLELIELVEGVAKTTDFNTNLAQRGVLTTSWNGEATADDVLFSLTFKATASGLLSDLIAVNSDLTVAEAYNATGELLDVNIKFTTATVTTSFKLEQNTPNPFNGKTVIGFNLPKAGTAILKVMDIQGKVLKQVEGEFVKGYNSITFDAKKLGATGVLHYQLESADNVATKKMIIIE